MLHHQKFWRSILLTLFCSSHSFLLGFFCLHNYHRSVATAVAPQQQHVKLYKFSVHFPGGVLPARALNYPLSKRHFCPSATPPHANNRLTSCAWDSAGTAASTDSLLATPCLQALCWPRRDPRLESVVQTLCWHGRVYRLSAGHAPSTGSLLATPRLHTLCWHERVYRLSRGAAQIASGGKVCLLFIG